MEAVWIHALVFLLAAAPFVELWIAIPAGVALGLAPVAAAVLGVAGNVAPIVGIYLVFPRARRWLYRRFLPGQAAADAGDASLPALDPSATGGSRRRDRFRRLWRRCGIPGVALAAPISTGAHLAAVLALLLGASPARLLGWMTASLAAWGVGAAVASHYGLIAVRGVLGS